MDTATRSEYSRRANDLYLKYALVTNDYLVFLRNVKPRSGEVSKIEKTLSFVLFPHQIHPGGLAFLDYVKSKLENIEYFMGMRRLRLKYVHLLQEKIMTCEKSLFLMKACNEILLNPHIIDRDRETHLKEVSFFLEESLSPTGNVKHGSWEDEGFFLDDLKEGNESEIFTFL